MAAATLDDCLRLAIAGEGAGVLCASRGAKEARSATGWLRERTKRLINVQRGVLRVASCRWGR